MVSVIIPVYKAEKFLDECLGSVIGQNYTALEIKTIHKNNEGPGMAGNTGLERG